MLMMILNVGHLLITTDINCTIQGVTSSYKPHEICLLSNFNNTKSNLVITVPNKNLNLLENVNVVIFISIYFYLVVTVQLLTTNYIVAEETGSFGVSVQKEGETAVDFNVTLSVMPLNGITAEGMDLNVW